ncbi:hypothetical protein [Nocardia wallacei]|uniref:hypothetical protein n=1 Tax=Nocardia wallacei TaxID=480035 RepID=UPI00245423F8|nr:hypothetical protein [Nocardia wallacei]
MINERPDATVEPTRSRYQRLMFHARRGGYRLLREPSSPNRWSLYDAADGEPIVRMCTLDEVEQWLGT